MHAPECIWDARAELGEGVRYDAATDSVWWVDILGRKVFCLELATGRRRQWDTPDVVGTTFPCSDGDVLLLLRHSLARLDQARGTCSPILDFPDEPATNRFNDGVVGPDGCIWVGSMDFDFQRPTGSLYMVRPDLSVARAAEGFTVINGPAFSPDGSVLYLCDTMSGVIYAFDRDAASNALSHKRVFLRLAEGDGLPDGICVDQEGGLWIALVTGGRVRRFSPEGRVDAEIALPSPIVTSVTIGGRDGRTLFVTTGRILLDEPALAAHPLSGGLFRVAVRHSAARSVSYLTRGK